MWCLHLLLTSSLILAFGTAVAAKKACISGIDLNSPLFACVDRSGNPAGFDVKVLDRIAGEMGFKVTHKPMNREKIIPGLKAGTIDIIASGMSITEDRLREVAFSTPYWKISRIPVVREGEETTAEKVLSGGNRTGVQRGIPEAKWIEENLLKRRAAPSLSSTTTTL